MEGILTFVFVLASFLLLFSFARVRRLLKRSRRTERILVEDSLKHLFEAERRERTATIESLAGALEISTRRAAEIVNNLGKGNLARPRGNTLELTGPGRKMAVRLVRLHRLWEKYLADQTGVDSREWHEEADEREHYLTDSEAAELERRLGHPRYDPHGDPIPTVTGELPSPEEGSPLSEMSDGERAGITHIEDEPGNLYRELTEQGFEPGMEIEMVSQEGEITRLNLEGVPKEITHAAAANIFVDRREQPRRRKCGERRRDAVTGTLAELAPGETGEIVATAQSLRGLERRRLMDLGFLPGTKVRAELKAMSGGVTAYRIRGSLIALRPEQAEKLLVRRVGNIHRVAGEPAASKGL
ncbi:MAG: hypothetical protein D6679_00530 [Candidatus Hydrogenedentota bacterium]|nr:MAG: hypothetical protein D6679_00530 [Candidatus Hydrogenedentota bacterium]